MAFQLTAKYNATNVTVPIMVIDSTDGTPEVGYAYNTAGIDLWYRRGAVGAEVSITEATQTITGAHSDGGVVHISDGRGRLDLPDAAVATGVDFVEYGGTITGMIVIGGFITLEAASSAAQRVFAEKMFLTHVLTTQTSPSATTIDLEGIVPAATPAEAITGEILSVWDAGATFPPILVRVTAFAVTTLIATVEQLDGTAMPFTPASGDFCWRVGQFTADTVKISGDTTAADNLELFTEGTALSTLPKIDVREIVGTTVLGAGTSGNKWRA